MNELIKIIILLLQTERIRIYKKMMELEMDSKKICMNKLHDIFYNDTKIELEKIINNIKVIYGPLLNDNELLKDIDKTFEQIFRENNSLYSFSEEFKKKYANDSVIEISNVFYENINIIIMLLIFISGNKYEHIKVIKFAKIYYKSIKLLDKLKVLDEFINIAIMVLNNDNSSLKTYINIKSELNNLLPDSLGSLKSFYIEIISQYYDNLHPVIWLYMFEKILNDITLIKLFSSQNMYKYMSNKILLNSGPFMLKILQLITPFLSKEIAEKYDIKKLTYPLMSITEIDLLLKPIMIDYDSYTIIRNFSASVGHVCFVKNTRTNNIFVIKIIKPLSILQSCAEYDVLHNMYSKKTRKCEYDYVNGLLRSNDDEMNVQNEIANIKICHTMYNMNYKILNKNVNVQLTTIRAIENIFNKNTRYAMAMTIANGENINELLEKDILNDKLELRFLHRCFDLLVYSFFKNILMYGYYHGDLHGGNMLYNKQNRTLTLIDFGSVPKIDLLKLGNDTKTIIKLIMCISYGDYDAILDTLTDLINSKCECSDTLDKTSTGYNDFKMKLCEYKRENMYIYLENSNMINIYEKYLLTTSVEQENKGIIEEINMKGNGKTLMSVMDEIMAYYTSMNVNIIIKLGEYYEFQKAFMLLHGVSTKINYDNNRFVLMIRKSLSSANILKKNKKLLELMPKLLNYYIKEDHKYKKLTKSRETIKNMICKN